MARLLSAVLFVAAAAATALPLASAADPIVPDSSCTSTCASEYVTCGASCTLFACQSTCADAYWSCLKECSPTVTVNTPNSVVKEVTSPSALYDCAYWQNEYQRCSVEYIKDGEMSEAYYKCIRLPVLAIQDDPTCSLPNEPHQVKRKEITTAPAHATETVTVPASPSTTSSVDAPGPACLPTCQAVYAGSLGNCYAYAFLPVQYSACLLGAQQTLAACSAECMLPGGVAASVATDAATATSVKMGGVTCLPDCQAAYANDYAGCYWNIANPVQYTACIVSAGQQLSKCIQECVTPGAPNAKKIASSSLSSMITQVKATVPSVGDSFDCVAWGREQMDYAWTVCTTDASTLEDCLTRSAQVWSKNYLDCIAHHQSTPTVKVASSSSRVASRLARRLVGGDASAAASSAKECELQFSYCMSSCESNLQSCTGHTAPATCAEWYKECTVPLFKGDDSCTSKLQRCNQQNSPATRA